MTALQRRRNLARARVWRIANKPYFDALYGSHSDHAFPATERVRGHAYARAWRVANAARFSRTGGKSA